MAIAADLLGLDVQALRRLAAAAEHDSPRPSGNQRRYSRNDIALLARAGELSAEGFGSAAIARILELERHVDHLTAQLDGRARHAAGDGDADGADGSGSGQATTRPRPRRRPAPRPSPLGGEHRR